MTTVSATESRARQIATVREYCRNGTARLIRTTADLRLGDIARELGVSVQSVSAWERGTQRPSGERAVAYLSLLRELCQPTSPLRRDAGVESFRRGYAQTRGGVGGSA